MSNRMRVKCSRTTITIWNSFALWPETVRGEKQWLLIIIHLKSLGRFSGEKKLECINFNFDLFKKHYAKAFDENLKNREHLLIWWERLPIHTATVLSLGKCFTVKWTVHRTVFNEIFKRRPLNFKFWILRPSKDCLKCPKEDPKCDCRIHKYLPS